LQDDWTGIRAAVNKMYGASGVANPVVKSLLLGMETLEGRKQGRVDVHDCIWKGADHDVCQNSHETGQDYQVYLVTAQNFNRCGVIRSSFRKSGVFMDNNRYTVPGCTGNSMRIRFVTDNTGYFGIDLSRFYPVDNGLKVGAAP
jgi:hypothetical protein